MGLKVDWEAGTEASSALGPGDIPDMEAAAACCAAAEGLKAPVFAHVTITGDEEIQALNRHYRGVDRATDVLSFPAVDYPQGKTAGDCPGLLRREYDPDEGACFLGDIVISLPTALRQAAQFGHGPRREALYLLTHGLFHLMGYDHMTKSDKERMRAMEEKALDGVKAGRVSDQELLALARKAMERSYSPYSKYRVGAALLTKGGDVYLGCNIENASYGASNCAERTALFKAVSEGERHFSAIAIAADKSAPWPCGICRQALNEFAPDLRVLVTYGDYTAEKNLRELLPEGFGPQAGTLEILGKD